MIKRKSYRKPSRKIAATSRKSKQSSFRRYILSKKNRFYLVKLVASTLLSILVITILQWSLESSRPLTQKEIHLLLLNHYNETEVDRSIAEAKTIGKPRIPHHIVLLDSRYDSLFDVPSPLQENLHNTIEKYLDFWDDTPITSTKPFKSHYDKIKAMVESPYVWYLNNTECENAINAVAADLLPLYRNEKHGQNKANICRIAAVYLRGGYYFDTDMQVVKPVHIDPTITFVSPWEAPFGKVKGLFNSFIAVAPRHPMIKVNIELMRDFYVKRTRKFHLLGTGSLYQAFLSFYSLSAEQATNIRDGKLVFSPNDESMSMVNEGATPLFKPTGLSKKWPAEMVLAEFEMTPFDYPNFPRHDNTEKHLCDYVVHNFQKKEIYFYSRFTDIESCGLLHKIPRRAVFIDPSLETLRDLPNNLKLNVKNTAEIYTKFWTETEKNKLDYEQRFQDKGVFLGNKECKKIVEEIQPRLLPYFLSEQSFENKRKLCKLTYLFDKGGYYFDTDLEVKDAVAPMNDRISYIQPKTRLSHGKGDVALIDSFMAASARHPLIRMQLENLREFYSSSRVSEEIMTSHNGMQFTGEKSMMSAIDQFYVRDGNGINVEYWALDFSLQERTLNFQSQATGEQIDDGTGCTDIIGSDDLSKIYFYIHKKGDDKRCARYFSR